MKQGKRMWAARYLMIIGCRLFVYRYPVSKKKGNENIPLNVIDLSNALISRKNDSTISITTHREYEFRFSADESVSSWLMELKNATARGISLFTDNSLSQEMELLASYDYAHKEPMNKVQEDDIISTDSEKEDCTHNSLLNPLPSYINSASSLKKPLQFEDDSIPSTLFAWGLNSQHQLALPSMGQTLSTPTKVTFISSLSPVTLAAGLSHVMCMTDEGELYVWGDGSKGQLGLGSTIHECVEPHCITSFSKAMVMSIACGGNHSTCLTSSGNIYTWGCGSYGQLGQGIDVEASYEPLLLHKLSGKDICDIACGQNHTLFRSSNGSVYACGNGYYGQLGLDQENDYFSPVVIKALLPYTITQIACGETFSLFLSDKNVLIVTGMLEVDDTCFAAHRDELATPHIVPFNERIVKIAAGTRFALLLTKGNHHNDVYYWKAEEGSEELARPKLIVSLSTLHITDITCGTSHCIAYSSETGRAFAWGTNMCGELGNGSFNSVMEPTEILLPEEHKLIQIVAGHSFTLGLCLPMHGSKGVKVSPNYDRVIDEVQFSENESNETTLVKENSSFTETTKHQPSVFTFNTIEIAQMRERPRSINSSLSATATNELSKKATTYSPVLERKNASEDTQDEDICFQSRARRAAALEKQFQAFLKK